MSRWIAAALSRPGSLRKALHFTRRVWRSRWGGYPSWKGFHVNGSPRPGEGSGRRVLLATSVGAHLPSVAVESLLAAALRQRGAEVHVLLCDGVLPACLDCDLRWYPNPKAQARLAARGPRNLCPTCFEPALGAFKPLGVRIHRYSDWLRPEDVERARRLAGEIPAADIGRFAWDGMAVGEHARAGALRFFARGDLAGEPAGEAVLRSFFEAALLTTFALRRFFDETPLDCAVMNHGIYVPQGLIGEAARKAGVRVVTWNPGYRKKTLVFSHGDTYHHTMMTEPVGLWEDMDFPPAEEERLMNYLRARWDGREDWISFQDRPRTSAEEVARELNLDRSRPSIGLLTNVVWDAQLHYPDNAFGGMLEWLEETLRYFSRRKDVNVIVRVHPGEVLGAIPSRQRVQDEIARRLGTLPDRIHVIGPESRLSTYAAMTLCDSVVIYGTKTGVELTSMGIPVVVAGEAWIRNKGFTMDAISREDYFRLLDRLPLRARLPEDEVRRARKYAYHFFFRRMIPVKALEPAGGWPPFRVSARDAAALAPGACPGLDTICGGILTGADFVFAPERDAAAVR